MVVKQEYKYITGVSAGIIFLFDRKQNPIEINQSLISFNNYWIWKYLIWMDIKFNLCIFERLGGPPLWLVDFLYERSVMQKASPCRDVSVFGSSSMEPCDWTSKF